MFPNVRLMIAAMVASVVVLSCGFAMFAAFRVNHEPLSRLATGATPLQLAAGNPMPSAAMPTAAESFGSRFPLNQAETAGAAAAASPPQPDHETNIAPPSAVASTAPAETGAATAASPPQPDHETNVAPPGPVASTAPAEPETGAAEPDAPEQATPVAQAPASEAVAKQNEAAPMEAPAATSDTAAVEPPAEQAPAAEPAAPREQASQETKPDNAKTTAAEPPPAQIHPKPVHRRRLAAKPPRARQARAVLPGSQPTGIGGPFVPLTKPPSAGRISP